MTLPRCAHNRRGYGRPPQIPSPAAMNCFMTLPAMCVQLLRVQSSAADTIACRADGLCGAPLMYAQSPRIRSSAADTIARRAERSHDAPSMCGQLLRVRSSAADTIARRAERSHDAPRDVRTVTAGTVVRRGYHRVPLRTVAADMVVRRVPSPRSPKASLRRRCFSNGT